MELKVRRAQKDTPARRSQQSAAAKRNSLPSEEEKLDGVFFSVAAFVLGKKYFFFNPNPQKSPPWRTSSRWPPAPD